MALTQAQWYAKLRSFFPRWYFQEEQNQTAHLQGLASLLATVQDEVDGHVANTMLLTAAGEYLDEHGLERAVARLTSEMDAEYRIRVQSLANQSNKPAIKAIVDALLINGESIILEDYEAQIFASREAFLNRGHLLLEQVFNAFSIVVDPQIHAPYSFCDREYFADRENYIGQAESSQLVFDLILAAVNRVKAFGALVRIIERLE